MPGKPHRRPAVLAVCSGVRKRGHLKGADNAPVRRAQANLHLHLVARRAARLRLFPREHNHRGAARLHGDERRIHFADGGLLRAKPAADARFFHANAAFRDAERVRQDAAHVEDDLRGRDHVQSAVGVQVGERAEGFHHGLVEGLRVIGALQHDIAIGEHRIDVAFGIGGGANQVARVIAAEVAQHAPVVFGVHQHRVVFGRVEVEHRLEDFIGDLDARKRRGCGLLGFGGHDGDHVAHIAHVPVDDQSVVGTGFRVGLPGVAKARLRNVFPGVDVNNAGDFFRLGRVDAVHDGVGMRAAQKLHHQRVGRDVLRVERLAQKQLQRVFLADRLAHRLVIGPIHARPLSLPAWP